jgi:hypothetical protein
LFGLLGRSHEISWNLGLAGVVPAPRFGGKEPPSVIIKHYKSGTYKRAALPLALFHAAVRTS